MTASALFFFPRSVSSGVATSSSFTRLPSSCNSIDAGALILKFEPRKRSQRPLWGLRWNRIERICSIVLTGDPPVMMQTSSAPSSMSASGVASAEVSLTNKLAVVAYDTNRTSSAKLVKVIAEAGFEGKQVKP